MPTLETLKSHQRWSGSHNATLDQKDQSHFREYGESLSHSLGDNKQRHKKAAYQNNPLLEDMSNRVDRGDRVTEDAFS